jgi:hypothetical protein
MPPPPVKFHRNPAKKAAMSEAGLASSKSSASQICCEQFDAVETPDYHGTLKRFDDELLLMLIIQ